LRVLVDRWLIELSNICAYRCRLSTSADTNCGYGVAHGAGQAPNGGGRDEPGRSRIRAPTLCPVPEGMQPRAMQAHAGAPGSRTRCGIVGAVVEGEQDPVRHRRRGRQDSRPS